MRRSACAVVLGLFIDPASAGGIGGALSSFLKHEESTASASLSDGGSAIYNVDEFSEPASEFVGGSIDAFLGHSRISGQERRCLSNGASTFASSLTESFGQAMDTYKTFMQQTNTAASAV